MNTYRKLLIVGLMMWVVSILFFRWSIQEVYESGLMCSTQIVITGDQS